MAFPLLEWWPQGHKLECMSQAVQAQTSERIRKALETNHRKMTVQLARELGGSEVEGIRCLPAGQTVELDVSRWEELIRRFEPLGQVHVIATNGAVTLECFGQFGNFSTWGEY